MSVLARPLDRRSSARAPRVAPFLATLFATLLLVLSPAVLRAQELGRIEGRVRGADGNAPLSDVMLRLAGTRRGAVTDADGRFVIDAVAPGEYTIEARRVGLATMSRPVVVRAGAVDTLDLVLAPEARALSRVTVIGSRSDLAETRDRVARVPGGAALVPAAEIRSTRQANLKDVLQFTPGVYVQSRFGAADESQISVRGSGLRSNFHARGINLLVNGMPYRNADGFTDFESLELLTTQAIEVYRGANALRYGGSTLGGAINLNTATGYTARPLEGFAEGGAFGFWKGQLASGGTRGDFDYYSSLAHTQLDGYRDWSAQRRDRVNLHAGYRLGNATDLRAFYFYAHVKEELPGSLTRAQLDADPRQADASNVANRWGRDYALHHLGLQLRAQLSPNQRLEVSPYAQYRDIDHPIFEVISQVSRDYGVELRYENTASLGARANRLTLGFQPAYLDLGNRQFRNVGGEHGALTKDQKDEATNLALYAEDQFALTPRLSAVVGARLDDATRRTTDRFLANGDQSDRRSFRPVTPRAGLLYALPAVRGQLYANASRTVEPPLLLELQSFGNQGGFLHLAAQDAWQYEIGTRGAHGLLSWDVSAYTVELRDELLNMNVQPFAGAPFTVPTYRNASRTRHAGLETAFGARLPRPLFTTREGGDTLALRASYTYGRFTLVRDSLFSGNDIPGAPRHHLSAELRYAHPSGLSVAPSLEWVPSRYFVNSANTATNDGWATLGLRAEWASRQLGVTAFVQASNLTDRRYSASVQVDNANGRYYEPADGRAIYAGLRVGQ